MEAFLVSTGIVALAEMGDKTQLLSLVLAAFAETARKRLGLDRVIWLVSPQNPLKSGDQTLPLTQRLKGVRRFARDRGMIVSDIEARLGTRYTLDTILALKARFPGVHFVWIMGADNLAGFHRWQRWQKIASTFPGAVIDRPGSTLAYLSSKMARTFDYARIDEEDAGVLWQKRAPAWTFIHGPRSTLSSSAIRAAAHKP